MLFPWPCGSQVFDIKGDWVQMAQRAPNMAEDSTGARHFEDRQESTGQSLRMHARTYYSEDRVLRGSSTGHGDKISWRR